MASPYKTPIPWPQGLYAEFNQGKYVMIEKPIENQPQVPEPVKSRRPDDAAGLNIDEHVKIWDRGSQETLLEKRA